MDIRQLEYFIETAKTKSFTRAAENMYISQQGISKSIKRLEEELGTPLFRRTSTAVVTTLAAEMFLPAAMEIVGAYRNGLAAIEEMRKQSMSRLQIGFSPGISNTRSSNLISDFISINSPLDVVLTEFPDSVLDKALENDLIDIGICIMPIDENKITIHHIRHEPTRYMLSDKHPLAQRDRLSLWDLKDEYFIGFGKENKGHVVLENRCAEFGFKPKTGIFTQDKHVIEDLCRKKLGVGFYMGEVDAEIPGIKIIQDADNWFCDICIATRKGRVLTPTMKHFISAMKEW